MVKAVSKQLATLNTNARYLHDNLSTHAEMLAGTMPEPLQVIPVSLTASRFGSQVRQEPSLEPDLNYSLEILQNMDLQNMERDENVAVLEEVLQLDPGGASRRSP